MFHQTDRHPAGLSGWHGWRYLLGVTVAVHVAIAACADEPVRQQRFIYNCDANSMFIYKQPPMTPQDVYGYVDEAADAGTTTFFISPNVGMVMNFPSKYARLLGDEKDPQVLKQIESDGRKKSGTSQRAVLNFRALLAAGHDPMKIIVDRAREKKMEAFISFRINEVHGVDHPDRMPARMIISQFWRENPQWHIGKPGAELSALHQEILGPRTSPIVGSWLPGGLNFAIPEVRRRRLDQLRECCRRYAIDGLDIDFQRFPIFFRYGQEQANVAVMTDWFRQVRRMTQEEGRRRGRPILLSARVMARPQQNLALGIDPISWAKEGLLDFLVVSHYLRNDFPLPVKAYRRQLPPQLPIYASIEVEPQANTYRRIASQLYRDGVDGIMMFNFFTCRQRGVEPDFDLLKELGSSETIGPIKK